MSRTRTENTHTNSRSVGRRVGEMAGGWRCLQCTFHNTEDICTMCQQPKPKMPKPIKGKNNNTNPHAAPVKKKPEEDKTGVYYDRTDGSFNVPIAGIKKYDHKPGKNIIKPPHKEETKQTSNIVTLNSLKNKPEEVKNTSNIATLSSLKNKPKEKPKIDGRRDLLGLLQDAATDEPLPCMRKPKK